jgi:foldase protein PrsA
LLIAIGLVAAVVGCGNQPVAVVNGTKITQTDFTERLEKTHGDQVLLDLILRALINDAFASSGLVLTDEEVQEEITKAVQMAPDQAAFESMLEAQGMTPDDFKDLVTFQLKVRKLRTQGIDATDEAVKAFFEENKDKFAQPEAVEFSWIVLSEESVAKDLAAQVKAKPEGFSDLARQHSLDSQTRDRGGRFPKAPIQQLSQLVPLEVQQALMGLQPGQTAGPIASGGNWFVVKLDARHAAKQPSFEEVKDQAKEAYLGSKAKSEEQLMADLRKSAQIHIVDAEYQKLNDVLQPEADSLPTFGDGENAVPADAGAAPADADAQAPPADAPSAEATDGQ